MPRYDHDENDYESNQELDDGLFDGIPYSDESDDAMNFAFAGDVHCLYCGKITGDDDEYCDAQCRTNDERRLEDERNYEAEIRYREMSEFEHRDDHIFDAHDL